MASEPPSPLQRAMDILSEHYDTVQIVATRQDGTDTALNCLGVGNCYARYGSVKEWLEQFDEKSRMEVRDV